MKRLLGRKLWAFPDGELPDPGSGEAQGHESLLLFNMNPVPARASITIFFDDRPPERDLQVVVGAERVCCVRLDRPIGDRLFLLPRGQYALLVESDEPIVAQIGRMDVRQPNLAYYTAIGFPLD